MRQPPASWAGALPGDEEARAVQYAGEMVREKGAVKGPGGLTHIPVPQWPVFHYMGIGIIG
jgi:hypothetical protein